MDLEKYIQAAHSLPLSYDGCLHGHWKGEHTESKPHVSSLKKQNIKLSAGLSDSRTLNQCNVARLFSFPSVPLLWPSSSSIKLSLSKLGELVTPVLNLSSLPLLNHPPSNPLFLTSALDRTHAAFALRLPRFNTCCWPLRWGTPVLAAILTVRHSWKHTQTAMCSLSLLCLTVFYTWTWTHTQFPGNHPHFPSIIRSHSLPTPSPCATQLCSTFLLPPGRPSGLFLCFFAVVRNMEAAHPGTQR